MSKLWLVTIIIVAALAFASDPWETAAQEESSYMEQVPGRIARDAESGSAGGITISQMGDSLRYDAAESGVVGNTINIEVALTYNQWESSRMSVNSGWWYAARVSGVQGLAPTFVINFSNHFQSTLPAFQHAVWAYSDDTDQWYEFDAEDYGTANQVSVSNDDVFTEDTVYIAHNPMYPHKRLVRRFQEWYAHPFTTDLDSGEDGVFDVVDGLDDPLDERSYADQEMRGFRILEGSGKRNILVLAVGNHMETPAYWTFEGTIEFLLSDDPVARNLRRWWRVDAYHTNPLGQLGGYFRSGPENPNYSHGGNWSDRPTKHSTQQKMIDAWNIDQPNGADVMIDFHSYANASVPSWTGGNSYYYNATPAADAFMEYLATLEDNFHTTASQSGDSTRRYYEKNLDVVGWTGSQESSGLAEKTIADWKAFGENQMRSLWARTAAGDYSYGP
jgi:hypothetical protein